MPLVAKHVLGAKTVATVPVEWLLKNVTDTVEFDLSKYNRFGAAGWQAVIDSKHWDFEYDNGNGDFLSDVLERGIQRPVCIIVDYDGTYSHRDVDEVPVPGQPHFTLGNGHHRVAAAVLLALDTIPCYFAFDRDYMHSPITDGGYGEPSCQ
jgi:hypothetical protein